MDIKGKIYKNPKLLIKKYTEKYNSEKRTLFSDNNVKNFFKLN